MNLIPYYCPQCGTKLITDTHDNNEFPSFYYCTNCKYEEDLEIPFSDELEDFELEIDLDLIPY